MSHSHAANSTASPYRILVPPLLLLTALPSLTSVPRRCLTKASTSAGALLTLTLCGTGGDPTQALPLQTFYFTP